MRRIFDRASRAAGLSVAASVVTFALGAALLQAQTPTQPKMAATVVSPAFEVATIRPAVDGPIGTPPLCLTPCDPLEHLRVDGSRVDFRHFSVRNLMLRAYRLKPYQVSPDNRNTISETVWKWIDSERFDIAAKIPDGVSTDRVPEMLQQLLADRFKLSLHHEARELPVYALVVDRKGLKLKESEVDADAPVPDTPGSSTVETPQGEARFSSAGYAIASGPYGPIRAYADKNGVIHMDLLKVTMQALVELLNQDRPVIDMTELKGYYQFSMERLSGQAAAISGEPPLSPSAVARAALAKVGLKLEPRTTPLSVIVIDHIEKSPSEN